MIGSRTTKNWRIVGVTSMPSRAARAAGAASSASGIEPNRFEVTAIPSGLP
jgi:hypothetical protein